VIEVDNGQLNGGVDVVGSTGRGAEVFYSAWGAAPERIVVVIHVTVATVSGFEK
jgi:hypothetical protein